MKIHIQGLFITLALFASLQRAAADGPRWTLPYSGVDSKNDALFTLTNKGTGPASVFLGNVGIGTKSPHTMLEIKSGFDTEVLRFGYSTDLYHFVSTSFHGSTPSHNYLGFNIAHTPGDVRRVLTLQGDGHVGIDATSPGSSLEVNGGIRARGGPPGGSGGNNNGYAFNGNGGDNDSGMFSDADGTLEFDVNANEAMRINSWKCVGIRVTDTDKALDVVGRIRLRDGPRPTALALVGGGDVAKQAKQGEWGAAGTAGVWLNTSFTPWDGGSQDIGFVGIVDATRIGFFGNDPRGGSGWGLTFDTVTGNVGIGTGTDYPTHKLEVSGDASVKTLTITGGADLAEPFQISSKDVAKGSLMVIDERNPGQLKVSNHAYDTEVAGIVSGAKGINAGITMNQESRLESSLNVALSGRVYALADASNAPIRPGDLLTSSDTPGHCMTASDPSKAQGAIIGKAMSPLDRGKGMVLVLVTLQ